MSNVAQAETDIQLELIPDLCWPVYPHTAEIWDQHYPDNKVRIGFKAMFVVRHSVAPFAVRTADLGSVVG